MDLLSSSSSDEEPNLDVYSESFDPLAAIYNAKLKALPDAPVMDNVEKFVSISENRRTEPSTSKRREEPLPLRRFFTEDQMPVPSKVKHRPNLHKVMDGITGPMALLRKIINEKLRAKIYIRGANYLRGYCIAYIAAFDKHWNMALVDVDEAFKKPRFPKGVSTGEREGRLLEPDKIRIGDSSVRIVKTSRRWIFCERHIGQLLLRGEHVSHVVVL